MMKQMPIKDSGQNACIVQPSWTRPLESRVTKLFVSENSMKSFERETNDKLLKILQTLDPSQKEQSYAISYSRGLLSGDGKLSPVDARITDIRDCQSIFKDERVVPMSEISQIELNFLEKAPLDRNLTKEEVDGLWTSLQTLHTHGVTHNDVHIHNVMYNPKSHSLVWSDFGEATTREDVDAETFQRLIAQDNSNFEDKVKNQFLHKVSKAGKKRSRLIFEADNNLQQTSERPSLAEAVLGIKPKPSSSKRLFDLFGDL